MHLRRPFLRLFSTSPPKPSRSFYDDLKQRGLVHTVTSEDAVAAHIASPTVVYAGVDPTATSMHLGNLVTLLGLFHFHVRGHKVIALVGGATGSIGDPSGKNTERQALSKEETDRNLEAIRSQMLTLFQRASTYASTRFRATATATDATSEASSVNAPPTPPNLPMVLNNYDWFAPFSAIDFFNQIGRHARINTMMTLESVKSRLDSGQGLCFTEFAYQLFQAYDFWHLHKTHGCMLQIGGNDQWGNITAGIDFIHRKHHEEYATNATGADSSSAQCHDHKRQQVYGMTMPLLTTASGEKFGKSSGNAIWLDETKTSVFDFYQFFMQTADADVQKYLRMFTFLSLEECDSVWREHMEVPDRRIGQKRLASEVTEMVHGADGLKRAQVATDILFPPKSMETSSYLSSLSAADVISAFAQDPRLKHIPREDVFGKSVVDVAAAAQACKSKGEARRLIKSGGLYVCNRKVLSAEMPITDKELLDRSICVLRTGKSSYTLVHLVD